MWLPPPTPNLCPPSCSLSPRALLPVIYILSSLSPPFFEGYFFDCMSYFSRKRVTESYFKLSVNRRYWKLLRSLQAKIGASKGRVTMEKGWRRISGLQCAQCVEFGEKSEIIWYKSKLLMSKAVICNQTLTNKNLHNQSGTNLLFYFCPY